MPKEFIDFKLFDPQKGKLNIKTLTHSFRSYILGSTCLDAQDICSPYVARLKPNKYRFELWGAGCQNHHNGGYVAGDLLIEQEIELFFLVGPFKSTFNSVDIGQSNGTKGNGASDIRLSYSGNWSEFESLKSRIIVAGAGGNNINVPLGSVSGVCFVHGNYGYAGGLSGYMGLQSANCTSEQIETDAVHSGNPGTQTNPGLGGYGGYCASSTGNGGNGAFGIGGKPGRACSSSHSQYTIHDGYAG